MDTSKLIPAGDTQVGQTYMTTHTKYHNPPGPFQVLIQGKDADGKVEVLILDNGEVVKLRPTYVLMKMDEQPAVPVEAPYEAPVQHNDESLVENDAGDSLYGMPENDEVVEEPAGPIDALGSDEDLFGAAEPKADAPVADAEEDAAVVEGATVYGLVKTLLSQGGYTRKEIVDQIRLVFPNSTSGTIHNYIRVILVRLNESGVIIIEDRDERLVVTQKKERKDARKPG